MDAATVVAAALAVVVEESRDAAMLALLQERERLAMTVADQASYLAQRHFVGSLQVPRVPGPPMTWQAAYDQRHHDLGLAHDAMRTALRAYRQGDDDLVERVLQAEVGSDDEEDVEMEAEEEEAAETDAIVEEPAIVPFSGAGHRLGD